MLRSPGDGKRGARRVAAINVENVTKVYSGDVAAARDVTLEIGDGEFTVLVGPSRCGKSTLFRMIAVVEEVTAGRICIGDRDVTDLAARHRDIAMVFQSHALYPHMGIRQNVGYGLKGGARRRTRRPGRVEEVAELLGLTALLNRRPAQLSGGQRGASRWAAQSCATRRPPGMDEPLSTEMRSCEWECGRRSHSSMSVSA
jgi:ABC-type sugar transport system ATPase subunit